LASFHQEGEAQLWFQILLREGREIGWPEFNGVFARFGPTQFYDNLWRVNQTTTRRKYKGLPSQVRVPTFKDRNFIPELAS